MLDRQLSVGEEALARIHDGPCRVVSAICWQTLADWRIAQRTCPDTLLFLSLGRQVDFTMRGNTRRVVPGDLVIVPTGIRHAAVHAPGCNSWRLIAVHALHTDAYAAHLWAGFAASIHQIPGWTDRLLGLTAATNRGIA